ncbi:hypothetical protein ONZ45_g17552 [Pleurotus djamor]|nr:hypothetical protein ONZ45_g17552 [Pleurotus djamor]
MAPVATTTEIISAANDTLAAHAALVSRIRAEQLEFRRELNTLPSPPQEILRLPLIPSPPASPTSERFSPPPTLSPKEQHLQKQLQRTDLPPAKRARVARYRNYVPEEETIRNDYSQRYVDGGEWPQNWVLGTDPERRFEEYPKQRRLLELKKASVAQHAVPSSFIRFSELHSLETCKFDVILIDPPFSSSFTWSDLQELPIPSMAADPSFVFLWVGSGAGEGLERGREVLAKWGYRRCEDVVWVKTNRTSNRGPGTDPPTTSLFTRTKQHCLIGIRGTVRRSTDSWFAHCNVDTDVIIWEGDPLDPTRKPPEMYTLIENFCLGTRRLEVFGRVPTSFRRGWVTVVTPGHDDRLPDASRSSAVPLNYTTEEGDVIEVSRWDKEKWEHGIQLFADGGKAVVPMTAEIDALRPKSPMRSGGQSGGNPGGAPGRMMGPGRGAFGGGSGHEPNQIMGQPVMGMANLGMGNMGMTPGMGMGVGVGVGVDEMMGWQGGGMGMNMGMGGMGIPTMMNGLGGIGPMGGVAMGTVNAGFQGAGFAGQNGGFNNMNVTGMGRPGAAGMFGSQMQNMGNWNDQGQYGLEAGWDRNEGMMGGGDMMNSGNGVGGSVNMGGINMNPGMGMGHWGSGY